jgi:hypothetical protein
LERRCRWDAGALARRRGIEAIPGLVAQQDERVVERPDQQRPRRQRGPVPHHDAPDDDAAKHHGKGQAKHPSDGPPSTG